MESNPRHRARRRVPVLLAAVLALCVAAGCASHDVRVDHDQYTDFSRMRSYTWAERKPAAQDPRVDNDLVAARVRRAADRELREAGYQLVDASEEPDFYLTYQSVVDKKLDTRSYYSSFPSYRYSGPGAIVGYGSVREIALGTLMLDVLEPEEQKLVWRGSAQARLHEDWSSEERTEHINEAVKQILERFPPED